MTAARTNPVLKLLDDQKIEQIHEASYRILRELGIKVEDADLRQELCDLGCAVSGTKHLEQRPQFDKNRDEYFFTRRCLTGCPFLIEKDALQVYTRRPLSAETGRGCTTPIYFCKFYHLFLQLRRNSKE
jgi:hypothetical protein